MKKITLNINAENSIIDGVQLLVENLCIALSDDGITIKAVRGDFLNVDKKDGEYFITYSCKSEFYRGLAICVYSIRTGNFESVCEKKNFDTCGVMLDMSRNSVYTVETIKEYLRYMALMGLNMLMLYTEDTYEIEEYPMFGYGRGRYTKSELKEIDKYAVTLGIELIPCIQTLGHLATTLKWRYAAKFKSTGNTLYVGKDETYEFIEAMFKTITECFSSKKIHVGLDEASDISIGKKILRERGYIEPFELMTEHINKVCELCDKYGLKPMMWSDMFFKNGVLGGDYDRTSVIPEDADSRMAKNIDLVYWEYGNENPEEIEFFIKRHRDELNRNLIFAGGIWTWNRLSPSYVKTFDTANSQLGVCKQNGVRNVFATVWCNTCTYFGFSILPGLQMYAEHMYNDTVSVSQLSHMFEVCTGYILDDFMCLGLDDFSHEDIRKYSEDGAYCINSSAQLFFNDVLFGLYDKTLSGYDFKSHYQKCLLKLEKIANMGDFNDLFYQAEILARILVVKSTIGSEIREAYNKHEVKNLHMLSLKLKTLLSHYEEYHKMAYKIWHKTNKAFGWEGMDIILGGVEARIKSSIRRLNDYLEGKCDRLEELEIESLYYNGQEKPLTESGKFMNIMTLGNI